MAKKSENCKGVDDSPGAAIEAVFQALPPMGSPEYLAHVQLAPIAALPPEVLARSFRQLPPDGEAARATIARLMARCGRVWDYLGPTVAYARRWSRQDHEDFLQDGLRRILEVLPTPRGAYAEQSWHSFCRRELIEAWRERYGRRGERIPQEKPLECAPGDEPEDLFAVACEIPPWHAILAPSQLHLIERVARKVIQEIEDDFVRAAANAAWFTNERPPISGRRKDAVGDLPLTSTFDGKSRHQITRALRHADSQLAAALLADCDLVWTPDLQALLERLRGSRRPVAARVRGR